MQFATIGSHGLTHIRLNQVPEDVALKEIKDSKKILESITKKKVSLFSFPHGEFNNNHLEFARSCGYQRVFSIKPYLGLKKIDAEKLVTLIRPREEQQELDNMSMVMTAIKRVATYLPSVSETQATAGELKQVIKDSLSRGGEN